MCVSIEIICILMVYSLQIGHNVSMEDTQFRRNSVYCNVHFKIVFFDLRLEPGFGTICWNHFVFFGIVLALLLIDWVRCIGGVSMGTRS